MDVLSMKRITVISTLFFFAAYLIAARVFIYGEFSWRLIISCVISASIFFVIFYYILPEFARKVGKKMSRTIPELTLDDGKRIVLQEGANYLRGLVGVGGRLTLTNKKLVFQSHKFNFRNQEVEILVDRVTGTEIGKGFRQKVLSLRLSNGREHRFVIETPSQWVKAMQDP